MTDLMCPARLVCVRHGECADNAARVISTAVPGTGLTDAGRAQAAEVAESLASLNLSHVYTSPLRRTRETAAIIADRYGVGTTVLDELAEYGVGSCESRDDDESRRKCRKVLRSWVLDGDLDARLDGGESGHEVLTRFAKALETIADASRGQTVAVVSHAGTLTLGLSALCAGLKPVEVWGTVLRYCTPVTIEYEGSGWSCPAGWPAR